jgi:hypothetical protein
MRFLIEILIILPYRTETFRYIGNIGITEKVIPTLDLIPVFLVYRYTEHP